MYNFFTLTHIHIHRTRLRSQQPKVTRLLLRRGPDIRIRPTGTRIRKGTSRIRNNRATKILKAVDTKVLKAVDTKILKAVDTKILKEVDTKMHKEVTKEEDTSRLRATKAAMITRTPMATNRRDINHNKLVRNGRLGVAVSSITKDKLMLCTHCTAIQDSCVLVVRREVSDHGSHDSFLTLNMNKYIRKDCLNCAI